MFPVVVLYNQKEEIKKKKKERGKKNEALRNEPSRNRRRDCEL